MFRKIPIIFTLIALLGLQTAVAVADEGSGVITITVKSGDIVEVIPPTEIIETTPEAEAEDEFGEPIEVSDDGFFNLAIDMSTATIALPVMDLTNEDDITYTDVGVRIQIEGQKVTIPMADTSGEVHLYITCDVEMVGESGQNSEVVATNVQLSSVLLEADFTDDDADVGIVTTSFEVDLIAIDEGEQVKVETLVDDVAPSDEVGAAINNIGREQRRYTETAYFLTVTKTNLDNGKNLGEAKIFMDVDIQWLQGRDVNEIKIVRWSDEGEEAVLQELKTTYLGEVEGKAQFSAASPDGLSTFALTYISNDLMLPAYVLPLASSVGSIIVLSGLFWLIRRRRQSREIQLATQWSTGLNPEDWLEQK
ncbi:MAG: hypothetical protein HN929_04605 [Chloroflexi bacterium]|jgi:hypothetical protein|nr:hypothetical protein [Chloroflexota bacterium]MBT7080735.1 hypothetical protein [Chloroflexota bacterium]MBT7290878.1 hypothetical protein [Chloroflexota bacterium]